MKKCSYCGAEYPDDAVKCAIDDTPFEVPAEPPPPPEPPPSERYQFQTLSEEDRQKDFVTLVNCGSLPSADVIISRLRAAGIDAIVPDESFMQAMGGSLIAIGTIRVQVAPKDYDDAKELLSNVYEADAESQDHVA